MNPSELVGKKMVDLVHPSDAASCEAVHLRALESGEKETFCYRMRCKYKGEEGYWLRMEGSCLLSDERVVYTFLSGSRGPYKYGSNGATESNTPDPAPGSAGSLTPQLGPVV